MKLGWLCAEKVTALSLGIAGLMLGDVGLMGGGVVAVSGLIDGWKTSRRDSGLNSNQVLSKARKDLLNDYASWAEGRELLDADLIAADHAMADNLLDCVLPVADLAAAAFSVETFPTHVARLVVDRLAEKNPIFSDTHPARAPAAREFALTVMNLAVTRAKDQPAFLQRLTQEVGLLVPQHLVQIESEIRAIDKGSQKRDGEVLAGNARMEAMLRQITASQKVLAESRGVSTDKLRMLALRIVSNVENEIDAEVALSDALDELLTLREEVRRGSNFGDEVDEAIKRIFDRVEANDLDGASNQGADEFRRMKEVIDGLRTAHGSIVDVNLSIARMKFDAEGLAFWTIERRKLAEGVKELSLEQLRNEQQAWYENAFRQSGRLDMDVAICLAQQAVQYGATELERALCQNDLAMAMLAQGERSVGDTGVALLLDAARTFERLLDVYVRHNLIDAWAETQSNLGAALLRRAERVSGELRAKLLGIAIFALEAAIEVSKNEAMRADRARTQMLLGAALTRQADDCKESTAMVLYARAVRAFEGALEIFDRIKTPALWAGSQNGLGVVLRRQANRSTGDVKSQLLSRAVSAIEAGLQVRTRDTFPADWAESQISLGNVFDDQADLVTGDAGIELLYRAICAYEAALLVYTRSDNPYRWATVQENIGYVTENIADRTSGSIQLTHLHTAEKAFMLSLEIYDPHTTEFYFDKAKFALTRVKKKIAEYKC